MNACRNCGEPTDSELCNECANDRSGDALVTLSLALLFMLLWWAV